VKASDAMIELAEERVRRETEVGVAKIRTALSGVSGRLVCDCGEPIPEARRQAMPNTDKCADCAYRHESRLKRRA
jgi:RNA polymerase-binding transcription factor DksA